MGNLKTNRPYVVLVVGRGPASFRVLASSAADLAAASLTHHDCRTQGHRFPVFGSVRQRVRSGSDGLSEGVGLLCAAAANSIDETGSSCGADHPRTAASTQVTRSCCSAVISANSGRLRSSGAVRSATGNAPSAEPRQANAEVRWMGTG